MYFFLKIRVEEFKPPDEKYEAKKLEISKKIRDLQGDIFDLMYPEESKDEFDKYNLTEETMKWYKGVVNKYKGFKNTRKNKSQKNIMDSIAKYQGWLDTQKVKVRKTNELPEEERPFIKHWLSGQLTEVDLPENYLERAKDISIFNIERYDISDPRNVLNLRRREEK